MSDCPACKTILFYRRLGQIPLGEQIRQARLNLKLSQHQLEVKLHVNRGYLSRVESGKVSISLRALRKITNVLGEVLVIGPSNE